MEQQGQPSFATIRGQLRRLISGKVKLLPPGEKFTDTRCPSVMAAGDFSLHPTLPGINRHHGQKTPGIVAGCLEKIIVYFTADPLVRKRKTTDRSFLYSTALHLRKQIFNGSKLVYRAGTNLSQEIIFFYKVLRFPAQLRGDNVNMRIYDRFRQETLPWVRLNHD
jgi:hypothetical protein